MVNKLFRIVTILVFGFVFNIQESYCIDTRNKVATKVIEDLYELMERNYNNSLEGKSHLNKYVLYLNPYDLSSAMCTDPYLMDNVPTWEISEIWSPLNADLCEFNTDNVFDFNHYGIVIWYPENNEDTELYDLMYAFTQQQDGESIAPYMGGQANGGLKKSFKPILDEIQDHVNNHFECPTPVSGELIITIAGYQPFRDFDKNLQYKTQTKTIAVPSTLMTEYFDDYIEFVDGPNNPHSIYTSLYYGKLYKRLAGYIYYFQNINDLPSGTSCSDFPSFENFRANNMVSCYCGEYPNMTDEQTQMVFAYANFINNYDSYFAAVNVFNSTNACVNASIQNWFYHIIPDYIQNGGDDDWKEFLLSKILNTPNYPDIASIFYLDATSVADHIALTPGQRMGLLNAIAMFDPINAVLYTFPSAKIANVDIENLKLVLHEFLNTALLTSSSDILAFKNLLSINTAFLDWLWDDVLDTILGDEAEKESVVTALTQIALSDFAGAPSGEAYTQAFGDKSFIWKLNPRFGWEEDHHTYEDADYTSGTNQISFEHKYVVSKTTTTTFNPYATQGSGINTHTNIQFDNKTVTLNPFDIVCVVPGKDIKWNTDCWSLLSGTACDFSAKFMPAYALAWYITNNQGTTTFEQFSTAIQVATFAVGAVVFITAATPVAAIVAGFVLVADAAALVAAPAYQYAAFDPEGEADPNEISAMAAEIQGIADIASLVAGITELGLGGLKGFQAYFRLRSLGNGAESVDDFNKALVALRNLVDTDPSDIAKICDHLGIAGRAKSFISGLDQPGEIKLVLAGWLKSKPDLLALVNASNNNKRLNFLLESLESNALQKEIIRLGHTKFMGFLNDFDEFFDFIPPGGNPNLLRAWKAIEDLPVAIRTNLVILSKGDELMALGFTKNQFRTLATLEDANALDIAKRLRQNHNIDFDKITNMVDNSYILGDDFITSIDNISQGPGTLLNPQGLNSELQKAVDQSDPFHGIRLTSDDAGKRINSGNDIEIENGHADLEDITLQESVQHKLMTGGDLQMSQNINKATKQLRGESTPPEIPSFSNTTAHLKIWETSPSIYNNYTKQQLFDHISDFDSVNYNLNGATKLVIENATGEHVFSIIDGVLHFN